MQRRHTVACMTQAMQAGHCPSAPSYAVACVCASNRPIPRFPLLHPTVRVDLAGFDQAGRQQPFPCVGHVANPSRRSVLLTVLSEHGNAAQQPLDALVERQR